MIQHEDIDMCVWQSSVAAVKNPFIACDDVRVNIHTISSYSPAIDDPDSTLITLVGDGELFFVPIAASQVDHLISEYYATGEAAQ